MHGRKPRIVILKRETKRQMGRQTQTDRLTPDLQYTGWNFCNPPRSPASGKHSTASSKLQVKLLVREGYFSGQKRPRVRLGHWLPTTAITCL